MLSAATDPGYFFFVLILLGDLVDDGEGDDEEGGECFEEDVCWQSTQSHFNIINQLPKQVPQKQSKMDHPMQEQIQIYIQQLKLKSSKISTLSLIQWINRQIQINMKPTPLLLLLFYAQLVLSSSVATLSSPRRLAAINTPRLLPESTEDREQMLHIEKLIDILNDYELKAATAWQPYADLKATIDLSFSQYVIINIRIAIAVSGPCRMKLRVVIDGIENKQLRREVGQTKFIVLIPSEYVWLGKGKHTIQVQFVKTGSDQTIQNNRINMALLKLAYLNRKQPIRQPKTTFVQSTYPISLVSGVTWNPFPDLKANIKLEVPTEVAIYYKTAVYFDGEQSYLATRLMIDGKQNQLFTYHTLAGWWPVNFGSYIVELQAGFHQIRVEYRTGGKVVRNNKSDWNRNYLQVRY